MKKLFALLLIITPLISSCRGAFVNSDKALEIIQNINEKIKGGSLFYNKFTYKYSSTFGDEKTYIKVTYDAKSQFYNRYVINQYIDEDKNTVYKTSEYWSYVKDNKFYDLVRYDGAQDEKGEPLVTYVSSDGPIEYKDEYWEKINDLVSSDIYENYLAFTLRNMEQLANYKKVIDNAEVTFNSANETSIAAYGDVDLVTFDYQIEELRIKSYSFKVDETHQKEFTCNYKRAQITYLNL